MPDTTHSANPSAIEVNEPVLTLDEEVDAMHTRFRALANEARGMGLHVVWGVGGYEPFTALTARRWGLTGDENAARGIAHVIVREL